jgi:hypothetical protein
MDHVSAASVAAKRSSPAGTRAALPWPRELFRSALYVAAQLLGSVLTCLLLAFLTGAGGVPVHALRSSVGALRGVLMEPVHALRSDDPASSFSSTCRRLRRRGAPPPSLAVGDGVAPCRAPPLLPRHRGPTLLD